MKKFQQAEFAEPEERRKHDYDDQPIVIHARSERVANELVLLVHGLTGHRYGYWGDTPRFLIEDLPRVDIGLYYYRTAWKRFGLFRSIDLEDEAKVLACALREVRIYRSITIVAHSMGGILAKAAIADLLNRNDLRTIRKLRGLILMACPQLGSLRLPNSLKWVSRDGRALFPHNRTLQRTADLFSSRLEPDQQADSSEKYCLPTWAVIAAEDFWVDVLSAGIGIPDRQRLTVRGSHSSIIRPRDKSADSYIFVRNCLDTSIGPELSRDLEEIHVNDARPEDAWNIRNLAIHYFGEGVTPEDVVMQFISYGGIFKVVKRIIVTDDDKREQLSGYFCVIPLSGSATNLARTGNLRGSQITMEHVAANRNEAAALYVGAIAGRDRHAKALMLGELRSHLEHEIATGIRTLLTRPLSPDGLRLVEKNLFKPVNTEGIDHMYELNVPRYSRQLDLF